MTSAGKRRVSTTLQPLCRKCFAPTEARGSVFYDRGTEKVHQCDHHSAGVKAAMLAWERKNK